MTECDDGTEQRVIHVFHWAAADYRVSVFFTFRIRNLQDRNNQADQSEALQSPCGVSLASEHEYKHNTSRIVISCPCIWITGELVCYGDDVNVWDEQIVSACSIRSQPSVDDGANLDLHKTTWGTESSLFYKPSPPGSSSSPTCHCHCSLSPRPPLQDAGWRKSVLASPLTRVSRSPGSAISHLW